ncbi:hypothetical protein QQF64_002822 [Cirrhinus molitorella]|uniref:Uncharacterized protein n=1 Tax=Cirrhinus molitorella TaxID=172907 RepID=A0ABR3MRA3_9TELE
MNRSRRSNVRLMGLPEKAEGRDPCGFLEGMDVCEALFLISTVVVRQERQHYNDVKKKLRAKGLDYRFNFPSWLQVSFNGTSYTFDNPGEVEAFLDKPSV